ncbi:reverse transcriptase domain-containing protein, partial [Patescibacteria group bacterium]
MERLLERSNIWSNPEEISEILEIPEVINALASYLNIQPHVIIESLELRKTRFIKINVSGQEHPKIYRYGYNSFTIAKSNGRDFREINDSAPCLKIVQQKILLRLYKHPLSPSATGSVPGRGLRNNVLPHLGKGYLLKFDVKGAFNNTTPQIVARGLDDFLNNLIHKEIENQNPDFVNLTEYEIEKFKQAFVIFLVKNNELPQGAPTSPYVFNMVFQKTDQEINSFLDFVEDGAYTRYLDDLIISLKAFKDFFLPWLSMGDINQKLRQVNDQIEISKSVISISLLQEMVDSILLELIALAHTTYNNSDKIHVRCLLGRLEKLELLFKKTISLTGIPRYPGVEQIFEAIFRFRKKIESLGSIDSVKMIQDEVEHLVRKAGFELNPDKTKIWTPDDEDEREFTGVKINKKGELT